MKVEAQPFSSTDQTFGTPAVLRPSRPIGGPVKPSIIMPDLDKKERSNRWLAVSVPGSIEHQFGKLPYLHASLPKSAGAEKSTGLPQTPQPMKRSDQTLAEAYQIFGSQLSSVIAAGRWLPQGANFPASQPWVFSGGHSRLERALHVARLLLEVEDSETVRAWFAGKNPMLDDRAPAIVIATEPDKVRFAAQDLVAHG